MNRYVDLAVLCASGSDGDVALPSEGVYDFETDLEGWTILGECASSTPSFGGSPQIQGDSYAPDNTNGHGQRIIRSQNPGFGNDWTTGILESPSFLICDDTSISVLIAGGSAGSVIDPENVDCSGYQETLQLEYLDSDGTWKAAGYVNGNNNVDLRQKTITPPAAALNKEGRLRAYDLSTGGWGHITFDYVVITGSCGGGTGTLILQNAVFCP